MKLSISASPRFSGDPADGECSEKQNDGAVEQDLAPEVAADAVGTATAARDQPESGQDCRRLHRGCDSHHVAFRRDSHPAEKRTGSDKGYDRDRAVMPCHGRGIDDGDPRHQAQQSEGDHREQQRQHDAGNQRRDEPRLHPMGRNAGAAFEADGEEQIKGQPLGYRLREGQVGARERRRESQNKTENDR